MIGSAFPFLLLLHLLAAPAGAGAEEGIVREAWALERDPVLRPAHVDPAVPGTFEDGLAPWAEALNASASRFKDKDAPGRLEASFDRKTFAPEDWRAEVERSAALLDGALQATHRAGARLPSGGRLGGIFDDTRPGPLEFQHLARLGLLDARLASERGDHALALRRCADVLAISRDFSWGSLLMAMVGKAVSEQPVPWCLQFAGRAPLAERRRFLEAVARVRAGWGPRAAVIRQERLFGQLLSAASFSEENRAALPPALEPVVKLGPDVLGAGGLRGWLFGGLAREAGFRQMTRLMEVADGLPGEADPAIAGIDAEVPAAVWLAGRNEGALGTSWLRMIRGLRETEARLALLQAALAASVYQAGHGAWPRNWTDLFPSGAPLDPRTGRALALELAPVPRVRAEADASREIGELSLPFVR